MCCRTSPPPSDLPSFEIDWNKSQDSFGVHAFAGSVAGVAEHLAMYPVDVVRTRAQVYSNRHLSVFRTSLQIFQESGVRNFYRGAQAITLGSIPAHVLYFSIYEACMANVEHDFAGPIVAGSLATLAHDLVLNPTFVVKQRMQLGQSHSMLKCIGSIVENEGYFAFYRSFPVSLALNIPFGITFMSCNEELRRRTESPSHLTYFGIAAISGALASAVTHPMDLIRTRLQTQDALVGQQTASLGTPKYLTALQSTRLIYAEEGLHGFFRGFTPRIIIQAPSCGICWGTYEAVKRLFS